MTHPEWSFGRGARGASAPSFPGGGGGPSTGPGAAVPVPEAGPAVRTAVAIVDDHAIAAEGVAARLAEAGFAVVGLVPAVEALDDLEPAPDVIICDLRLPGRSGADAVAHAATRGAAVLAASGVARPQEVLDAIAAGARGFLPKTAPARTFAAAATELAAGGYHVSAELAHHLLDDARARPLGRGDIGPKAVAALRAFERGDTAAEVAAALRVSPEVLTGLLGQVWDAAARRRRRHAPSPRELDLLRLVGQGLTHKDLAARLALSPATVPTILDRIRAKYLALHPDADPTIPPMSAARRWAEELGVAEG
jgi:DNA-binding NarL/FixJ family response regulator